MFYIEKKYIGIFIINFETLVQNQWRKFENADALGPQYQRAFPSNYRKKGLSIIVFS